MRVAFTEVNGIRTRYLFAGEHHGSTPLLLLHGFTLAGDSWLRNIDKLAEHRPVYAPDLLGHGRTDAVPLEGRPPHSKTVEHLLALVRQFGCDQIDIVGSSFGALMGLLIYFADPRLVRRIVIVGSAMCFSSAEELACKLGRVLPASDAAFSGISDTECRTLLASGAFRPDSVPEELVLSTLTYFADKDAGEFSHAALTAMCDSNLLRKSRVLDQLEKVTAETLVIWGQSDDASLESAKKGVSRMKRATLKIFDECGHYPYWEHVDQFNKMVSEFLDGSTSQSFIEEGSR